MFPTNSTIPDGMPFLPEVLVRLLRVREEEGGSSRRSTSSCAPPASPNGSCVQTGLEVTDRDLRAWRPEAPQG